MNINVKNAYAGCLCTIQLKFGEEWFGAYVSICGSISTPKTVIKHCETQPKFVANIFVCRIPRSMLPTYTSKNFRVNYTIECVLISKNRKQTFKSPLFIFNSNIADFSTENYDNFDLNLTEPNVYENNKIKICQEIIKRGLVESLSTFDNISVSEQQCSEAKNIYSNTKDQINDQNLITERVSLNTINQDILITDTNKLVLCNTGTADDQKKILCSDDQKEVQEFMKYVKEIEKATEIPVFSVPKLLEVQNEPQKYKVTCKKTEIATVEFSKFFKSAGIVKIEYHKNIHKTAVEIRKIDIENGNIIDKESVFNDNFNTDKCVCKYIKCVFNGYSLNTKVFEVKYELRIEFDNFSTTIPMLVIGNYTIPKNIDNSSTDDWS